jgi:nitroimidazol reductase NimA-like FMN-containing flavoprotein (pyridoxamine 5'-phosphate oxidase superfamily)
MADLDMTVDEREAFLADLHVGILSISRAEKGPLALPIWYEYEGNSDGDGDVVIGMAADSLKAKLLRRQGRASMTVQNETPPYQYVMVEGPVTVGTEERDPLSMPTRYLGPELGKWYAEQNADSDIESVVVRLTPERWYTCDYNKGM